MFFEQGSTEIQLGDWVIVYSVRPLLELVNASNKSRVWLTRIETMNRVAISSRPSSSRPVESSSRASDTSNMMPWSASSGEPRRAYVRGCWTGGGADIFVVVRCSSSPQTGEDSSTCSSLHLSSGNNQLHYLLWKMLELITDGQKGHKLCRIALRSCTCPTSPSSPLTSTSKPTAKS